MCAAGNEHPLAQVGLVRAECRDLCEALLLQEPRPPVGGGQRRAADAQLTVLEGPPALHHAAAHRQIRADGGQFVEHQQAAGLEQRADRAQGVPQVPGGVDDVGGDHRVRRLSGDPLFGRVALHIEQLEPHTGVLCGEAFAAVVQEARRDVGEGVADAVGVPGQDRQHTLGGGPGTGAQFQDLEGLPLGELRQPGCQMAPDGVRDERVEEVGQRVAAVQVPHQLHRGVGEHHLGPDQFGTQQPRIHPQELPVEGRGGCDVGTVGRGALQRGLPLPRTADRGGGGEAAVLVGQISGVREQVEQRLVQPPELLPDAERAAQLLGAVLLAGTPEGAHLLVGAEHSGDRGRVQCRVPGQHPAHGGVETRLGAGATGPVRRGRLGGRAGRGRGRAGRGAARERAAVGGEPGYPAAFAREGVAGQLDPAGARRGDPGPVHLGPGQPARRDRRRVAAGQRLLQSAGRRLVRTCPVRRGLPGDDPVPCVARRVRLQQLRRLGHRSRGQRQPELMGAAARLQGVGDVREPQRRVDGPPRTGQQSGHRVGDGADGVRALHGRGQLGAQLLGQQREVVSALGQAEAAVDEVVRRLEGAGPHPGHLGGQPHAQLFGVHCGPALRPRPVRAAATAQEGRQVRRVGTQPLLAPGRQHQQLFPGVLRRFGRPGRHVLLQGHAGVRPARAEGADEGPQRRPGSAAGRIRRGVVRPAPPPRPRFQALLHLERRAAEVDLRVAALRVQ